MIAIIAGTGALPIYACKSLLLAKKNFFVISLFPELNFEILQKSVPTSTEIIQKHFYKTEEILELLKERKTKKVLFIGKIDKQNLLKKIKLDWLAIKSLATLATKSDFSIMNKVAQILEKHEIEIISQDTVLENLFVKPGILTGTVSPELQENINFGLETAKKMSEYDIGQTVVVKDKMILAIEAIEGTDACIRRGIILGKGNVVVCKAINVNHNTKFDLPTIGTDTLKNIREGEVAAIAWKSDKTFVANKNNFVNHAKKLNLTLVSSE